MHDPDDSEAEEDMMVLYEEKSVHCLIATSDTEVASLKSLFGGTQHWADFYRTGGTVFKMDVDNQLFYIRKLCSMIPHMYASTKIWGTVLRTVLSTSASVFFMMSGGMPARVMRATIGGAYQNALHVCILTEVMRACVDTIDGRLSPGAWATETVSARLTQALIGLAMSSAIPKGLLASHLVMCVCNALIESLAASLQPLVDPTVQFVRREAGKALTAMRLHPACLARLCINEKVCDAEPEWTVSDVQQR